MTEPKFTPGPWGEDWNAPHNIIAENGSGKFVAQVARGGGEEASANARLIAAAPDLYEALEWAGDQLEALGVAYVPLDRALAKARGEA